MAAVETAERHLLVVDDDDRIRDLLKQYLTRHGFRVTTAPGGAHARSLIETIDFDLAVFDVMMPGEDGFSLVRWLRERKGAAGRTPVLMLTARGLAEDRIEGLKLGADDYLAKPFEPEELLLRIEAILRRSDQRPAGAANGSLSDCRIVDEDPAGAGFGQAVIRAARSGRLAPRTVDGAAVGARVEFTTRFRLD